MLRSATIRAWLPVDVIPPILLVDAALVDEKQFPTPPDLFTIADFGGWGKVNDEFFDDETGSVAKIEQELGVSTSG